jgi:TolB-like protein
MSGDPDQDYFVDGIVEEIITGLSRVKSLFVIARNSTLIYKGRAVDVKQVGRELGVRYVLEGSVRKVANRVRFTAQLVETENGIHIWAERYDRLLDDIFVVQDDIAMSVVAVIEPGLRKIEIERVQRKRTDNLDAYDLVLRSMPFVYTFVPQHADVAIPLLQKALELEPGYASSHAGLAWCFHFRFVRGGRREEDRITSTRHARAAVAAGADDATTLATAGIVIFFNEHDVTTAFELFDRALAVSPSNVIALGMSAVALAWIGNPDLAIERAHRALQLNPFEPMGHVPELTLSAAYFQTGRYEEARRAAQRASDANPNYGAPQAYLAAALVPLGHLEEARKRAQRARELDPTFTIRTAALMRKFVPEVFAPFADAWRKAGIPDD